jgi:FMN phosphatase YigB (HAD superfamily)
VPQVQHRHSGRLVIRNKRLGAPGLNALSKNPFRHGTSLPAEPMNAQLALPARRVKAIIFDLDDTLVDTFESLITPLETEAASEMVASGTSEYDSMKVAEVVLRLRRDDPERIEEMLVQSFPQFGEKALKARRAVFARASPGKLSVEPAVRDMLQELSGLYRTYLVTMGRPDFQHRKLDQLGIRELFHAVAVLPSGSEETKERWLSSFIAGGRHPGSVIVVGNRLDNEIKAGNSLGMITVWVKRGEGSGLTPCEKTAEPDYITSSIAEFPELLAKIESAL